MLRLPDGYAKVVSISFASPRELRSLPSNQFSSLSVAPSECILYLSFGVSYPLVLLCPAV